MTAARLEVTALPGLPTIAAGDDLAALTVAGLGRAGLSLSPGDVLAFAQKVVSKAEGRAVALDTVTPSRRAEEIAATALKDPRLVELILRESAEVLRVAPNVIVVATRTGLVMANAGIDASNVEERGGETVLLLPEDPDASATRLRQAIAVATGVDVGVVILDSFGRAWRLGTCGTAIGVSGLAALVNLRGEIDRNGRALQTSELALADEVAAAASLVMGQAAEGRPVAHLRGIPYPPAEGRAADLVRPKAMDLFR